jgi:hypothetical protein
MEDGIFSLEGKTNSERIQTSRFFFLSGWPEEGRGDIQVRKGRGSERLLSVIIKRGKKELRKRNFRFISLEVTLSGCVVGQ